MSNIIIDEEYRAWIQDISKRFRQSQIKAALKVNDEMLRFYWGLGKDISDRKGSSTYGSNFFDTVSQDLKKSLPNVDSFSPTNLRYMERFYKLYQECENLPQVGAEFEENPKLPQAGAESAHEYIFNIPWGHNKLIIDKCKGDPDKALFYVKKTLENGWSRSVLQNFLDTGLYERQGKALTNFSFTLPEVQSDLAQEITKDPYNFDFLTIRERYDEKELKDALMTNVEKFLVELGKGFAFIGREVRIEIGETENYIDLLFYHSRLHCYVVVEVKAGKFKPENMGQLGTYVVAVNHEMKVDGDNPTIGLLVCKSMSRVEAQYALESSSQPLGISSYELSQLIPDDYKRSLPTIEEIEAELSDPEGGLDE